MNWTYVPPSCGRNMISMVLWFTILAPGVARKSLSDVFGNTDRLEVRDLGNPRAAACHLDTACGHVYSYDGAVQLLLIGKSRGTALKTLEESKRVHPGGGIHTNMKEYEYLSTD